MKITMKLKSIIILIISSACSFINKLPCIEQSFTTRSSEVISSEKTTLYEKNINNNLTPYLLPQEHRLKPILNRLFADSGVLKDQTLLNDAGFTTLCFRDRNNFCVASHPEIKGYLLKFYINRDEIQDRKSITKKLLQRCISADHVRQLINKYKLQYFRVPKKWLYELPSTLLEESNKAYILVVQDMKIVNEKMTRQFWKNKAKADHLRELHILLSHGLPSCAICKNIPYTKKRKFACIDTEYEKRALELQKVTNRLPHNKRMLWQTLIKNNNKQ